MTSTRKLFLLVILLFALISAMVLSCAEEEPSEKADSLAERLERLRSIPYTATTSEPIPDDLTGVTVHDRERAWPGYNLYCYRTKPEAFLVDMDGNVVNEWSYAQDRFKFWNHVVLLESGDIIVLNKFWYIFKLDWNSNLIWERPRKVHHEIALADDGTLFAIELTMKKHRDVSVRFARIVHLTSEGEELQTWSTYDHLDHLKRALDTSSFLDTVLDSLFALGISPDTLGRIYGVIDQSTVGKKTVFYDYFHINTVSILPETPLGLSDARFAADNLLICMRNVNQIAILNWESGEVLWSWGEGDLEWPHHPTMLPDGNILVFDNGVLRRSSRVIELDPRTGTIEWEYAGDPPETFYTRTRGSAQRFPNGNTFVCEGDRARCFEVTVEGDIVWEWYNPIVEDGERVPVYRMMRYPVQMVEPLLNRGRK